MTPRSCLLSLRANSIYVAILLLLSAMTCLADVYSSQGTVSLTGTITNIEDQQTCNLYNCQIGSTWTLAMTFQASDWNAPGSNYLITSLDLNCIGGPPCFTGYQAGSDFGWGPYGFDMLSVQIEDGKIVDARAACGNYFIEWGEADQWSYKYAFSGTTSGDAEPTPDPATILTLVTGLATVGMVRYVPKLGG